MLRATKAASVLLGLCLSSNACAPRQPVGPTQTVDCRALLASTTTDARFWAGDPQASTILQRLQGGRVAVANVDPWGRLRILQGCSVAAPVNYQPRPSSYQCLNRVNNSAQLGVFVPGAALAPGMGVSANQSMTFAARSAQRFELFGNVFQESLEGPDCRDANAVVSAFVLGDYIVVRAEGASTGVRFGPAGLGAATSNTVVNRGTGVPLTLELMPIRSIEAQRCGSNRRPDVNDPSGCGADETAFVYSLGLTLEADRGACDGGDDPCDFRIMIRPPHGVPEHAVAPTQRNTWSYDVVQQYMARDLSAGVMVSAWDVDSFLNGDDDFLGRCAVRVTPEQLQSAATTGQPVGARVSCDKYRISWSIAATRR